LGALIASVLARKRRNDGTPTHDRGAGMGMAVVFCFIVLVLDVTLGICSGSDLFP